MRNGLMSTILFGLIVTLLLAQRHCGFILIFVLVVLIPWFAYSGYRCIRFPIERKLRIQKAVVWCVAVAVIVSSHLVMYQSAKSYAQSVVEKVEAYISNHGSCPAKLEEVGISKNTFKEHLELGSYVCENKKAFLFYASTYVPFDTEAYDFAQHEWSHNYD